MSDDVRKVRCGGEEGLLALSKLNRLVSRGDIDGTAEFWSEARQAWLPLVGIMFDIYPDRLPQMLKAGVRKVSILGSAPDDCPACAALQNKLFSIADVPALPPAGCSCVPWCRLTVIARA